MSKKEKHELMPYKEASHLLHPLRKLFLSPGKLVKRLYLQKNSRVLELGCGPGYFSIEVARSIPQGTLVLVDIQQEMLDMARKRLEGRGLVNVEYVRGDAQCLPLEDESFDVAFLVSVLGEVPDTRRCLQELHRVLKPNGLLSITEQPHDPDALPMDKILKLGQEEGFFFEKSFGRGKNFTVNFRKPPISCGSRV
ncbi:MAG: class I SAM-dependent methyltransferase [Moorellaceae bacterium]